MKLLFKFILDNEDDLRQFSLYFYLSPLLLFAYLFLTGSDFNNPYAHSPLETVSRFSAHIAMVFLLVTLAITPLRRWYCFICRQAQFKYGKRLSDWNLLIRWRRQFGVLSFVYASVHTACTLVQGGYFDQTWTLTDILKLGFGLSCWLLLGALSLTSLHSIRRKMGRRWRPLQRSIYFISIGALLHVYLDFNDTSLYSLVYAPMVIILLCHRIVVSTVQRFKRDNDDGLEVTR
jgi:sulfoxide reductase heme-binding subunit YedZ